MLNQFLTDCDTKSQLFARAGEQGRWQRGDQTLSAKKTISVAAFSANRRRQNQLLDVSRQQQQSRRVAALLK